MKARCELSGSLRLLSLRSRRSRSRRQRTSRAIGIGRRRLSVLALGDSLTDGFGLSRKEAYPALIAEKMRSANFRFEVINAGSSGDTTAGGLRRLPALLRGKKIDVLILALGINDAFRGVPIEQMRSNLQAIIDQTRARNPELNQWDRVHPNAAGQRVLADNVLRVLEPMIRKTEAARH